jgi:hypothetical protein
MRFSYILNAALAVPCVTALAVARDAPLTGHPASSSPAGRPLPPPGTSGPRRPPSPPAQPASPLCPHAVKLGAGSVQGFADASNNSVFLGIPFAETTGGENRYVAMSRSVVCYTVRVSIAEPILQMEGTHSKKQAQAWKDFECYCLRSDLSSGSSQCFLQSPR